MKMKIPTAATNFIRIISVVFFMVLWVATIKSQTTGIQKRIYLPKSNNAYSRDVVETIPGNFVLIGQSFDTIGNQIENRLTLAGVDNNGNLTWRKSYGGNKFVYTALIGSSRYILKHQGFLYAAMPVNDSTGKTPGVLIKFNFNGDTLWQKKYYQTNPSAQAFFTSVCPSVDNGFLVTGAIQTNTPGFNGHPTVGLYLLKTDLNGTKLWDKVLYKSNLDQTQGGFDVLQDSLSKKIIIVGNQENSSGGSANVMILDSIGNLLIQKGSGLDFFGNGLVNIIKLKDGNFLASGGVDYPFVNLDPTSRSFLVKFDTSANIIFKMEYDTISYDNGMSRIAELPDGTIITGGYLEVVHKYFNGLNNLLRIMKLDKNGNLLWKKYFDNYTDGGNTDALLGMCLTSNSEIAFTSFCLCPEPAPITFMFYRTDTSYCDLNAVGCYSYTTTGLRNIHSASTGNEFSLYPNPATEISILRTMENYSYKNFDIEIRDILGRLIFSDAKIRTKEYRIDCGNYPAGIYQVVIFKDENFISKQKLIVVR